MDKATYIQLDRIETKLNELLHLEGYDLTTDGWPIKPQENEDTEDDTTEEEKIPKIKISKKLE